jgi:4'-phosphopantetheinyl transferase
MDVYWLEQRGAEVSPLDDWLSAAELLRLGGLRFAKRRADWRLGRWTAKLAVSTYLNTPHGIETLREIEIRPEASGAPEVWLGGHLAPVTISLSHREGAAVCAVAARGLVLGCDLEVAEPRCAAFLTDYFTAGEQAFVERAAAADRSRLLALLWSAKESVLKALRVGLRLDTRLVAVTVPDVSEPDGGDGEWRKLQISCGGRSFDGWWRQSGQVVRTVAGAPPLRPPITLERPGIERAALIARA